MTGRSSLPWMVSAGIALLAVCVIGAPYTRETPKFAEAMPITEALKLADAYLTQTTQYKDTRTNLVVTCAEIQPFGPKPIHWEVSYQNRRFEPPREGPDVLVLRVFADRTVDIKPGK